MMAPLQRLGASLRRQGPSATAVKLWVLLADHLYDLRHGIDTCQPAALAGLTIEKGNRKSGTAYEPSRVLLLRKLFRLLDPVMPESRVLVDFGCGKGRVLLIASEFGFRKIRGVEFARELCEVAKKNCAAVASGTRDQLEWQITEMDAAKYAVRPDETVFFMYNPFDETVMEGVLDNVSASLRDRPRRALVIYYNPRASGVIEGRKEFTLLRDFDFWGYRFKVYSTAGDQPCRPPSGQKP